MSLNIVPIQSVKVIPPKFDYKKEKLIPILDGGESVLYQEFPATNVNTSSINVQANPPGKAFIVDNNVFQRFEIDFTINATNNSGVARKIFEKDGEGMQNICPRAYPLARVTETLNISINSSNINTNVNNYIDGILPYETTKDQLTYDWSNTPTRLDNVYDYSLGLTGQEDLANGVKYGYPGTARDVFNGNLFECEQVDSRGSFAGLTVVSNLPIADGATGNCVLKLVVVEKVFLSPFYYQSCGFSGIQTMSYLITLGDLSQMLSFRKFSGVSSTSNLGLSLVPNSISYAVQSLKLQMRFYSPKLLDQLPKITLYDYIEIQQFDNTSSGSSVAAGATREMTMSTVNLNSIPSDILFMVYENKNDKQYPTSATAIYKPDVSNAWIQNLNIIWNGKSGLNFISSCA